MIDDFKRIIREHEASRPRSRQRSIGASEAGHECDRRLAYKALGVEPVNTDSDPWAAIVGTAVHAWLDTAFDQANERAARTKILEAGDLDPAQVDALVPLVRADSDRWLTETRIHLPGYLGGTADLIDRHNRTVWDHKVVGATALKRYKKDGPSQQYRIQVHLYATGARLQGHDIDTVGIVFWARAGQLKDAFTWSEPYDEDLVEQTLARLDAIKTATKALGVDALPLMRTSDAMCTWCPFYLPAVTDVTTGCPGHQAGATPTAAPAA